MDTTKLIAIVSILITLGMASERLVEIIKGFIPTLNEARPDAKDEARRKAYISMLAIACGIFTAFLASPILAGILTDLFKDLSCTLEIGLVKLGRDKKQPVKLPVCRAVYF